MSFNLDRAKPAEEFRFSQKTKTITYPILYLSNLPIVKTASQNNSD